MIETTYIYIYNNTEASRPYFSASHLGINPIYVRK
jgi:hypothetical protein